MRNQVRLAEEVNLLLKYWDETEGKMEMDLKVVNHKSQDSSLLSRLGRDRDRDTDRER